ncbi:DUF2793 domain-containing protein [Shimia sp. FJ5]|uniref:DUF2793 domain-containing protein n=1 Tax=Shimia sp. FJ5 TaxID=3079054 RepID=UPI0026094AEF|nr:DUF2793 domain-containing protein [Shimia sp. FJ5]MDV4144707.1 DUF2793 domain-containing protein [Shimia sp. FJ5]
MSEMSPILGLPYLQPSQAQKHVTHNEALQLLDVVTQLVVEAFQAEVPPSVAEQGAIYALGGLPTGAWAGHPGTLAIWRASAWSFVIPAPGWRAWGKAESDLRVWDGSDWAVVEAATQGLAGLGVNTQSDAQNRLAVRADATLLTHEGAGHQVKVNKASAGDTASLLFQSNWTGFAEMGLAGSEAFSVKVSPDGQSWTEALTFDGATGHVGGTAVQANLLDETDGRLMPVGAFGLGAQTPPEAADVDDPSLPTGLYRTGVGTAQMGALPSAEGVLLVQSWDATAVHQTWTSNASGEVYKRAHDGSAWTGWDRLLAGADILGTVAYAGGVPTGAILERGSNGNGEYVRFADGSQICHATVAVDVTSTAAQMFGFAADFVATPSVSFGHKAADPNAALFFANIQSLSGQAGTDQHWTVRLAAAGVSADPTDDAEKLCLTAIGRWF